MKFHVSWGVGVVLVYSAFAIGTLGFVVFAAEQKVDLVSSDYYERALTQDRRTAAIERAASLGDAVAVDVSADSRTVSIKWPQAQQVQGSITLYRASNSSADRVMQAQSNAQGRQDIDVSSAARGRWQVQLAWQEGGQEYYVERIVELR
jgi:hypothetical protein